MKTPAFLSVALVLVTSMFAGCSTGSGPTFGGTWKATTETISSAFSGPRDESVKAAKADSDPVRKAIVLQNKDMYYGPKYGGTYFSADLYKDRKDLVAKRAEMPLTSTDRAEMNGKIKDLSDRIVSNETTKFTAKRDELAGSKTSNPDDAAELDKHIAFCDARLADLKRVPPQYVGDSFDVSVLGKEGGSMAAK